MAIINDDRVRVTTLDTGTGDLDFGPVAPGGYQPFTALSPAPTHGDPFNYLLIASNGQWETGQGVYMTLFGSGVPRIWRLTPKKSSSGPGVNVDFTVAPDCAVVLPARYAITQGSASQAVLSGNQVVAAATPAKVLFASFGDINRPGFAEASSGWNAASSVQSGFNQPGIYAIKAKVDAVTTFSGDSYLSLFRGGAELYRGPLANGAKSLTLDVDVSLGVADEAAVHITSAGGGTIDSTATRSYVFSRWVHSGD